MASIRQTNFLGGELDPLLWGRTDLDVFARGMRTMRNFFVSRQGAAVSRGGTKFVGYAGGAGGSQPVVRLVPFVRSDDQSVVLEFGHNYIAFHARGATILNGSTPIHSITSGATNAYRIASPYTAYDLDSTDLQWTQSGDILTITHPRFAPLELRRYGETNWGTLAAGAYGTVLKAVVTAAANPYFSAGTPAGHFPVKKHPFPGIDSTHPAREWIWLVTLMVQDTATGLTFETLPFRVNQAWTGTIGDPVIASTLNGHAVYPDKANSIVRGYHTGTDVLNVLNTTYRELGWNVYRGRGNTTGVGAGLYGFVGTTTGQEFVDTGDEPDYTRQPPLGTNPFAVTDAFGTALTPRRPTATAYFQERRVFGLDADLYFSETGNYTNYDAHIIPTAGQALHYQLASRKREQIVSLLACQKLLAFTKSSVWSMTGQSGEPLDFDSVDARLEDEVGSNGLPPLVVDGVVYFARSKGVGVRALFLDQGGFSGRDISINSGHLFRGGADELPEFIMSQIAYDRMLRRRSIIDWTYAEDPWGMVWVVLQDGAFLSFTPTENGGAWARHDTLGWVRSVCTVPEDGEDAVYMAVMRIVGGGSYLVCIERMASRVNNDNGYDDFCVDCAYEYVGAPTLTIQNAGLSHLIGRDVWVTAVGNAPVGPIPVVEVGGVGQVTLPGLFLPNEYATVVIRVGLPFVPELETLDAVSTDSRLKQKAVVRVGFEVDQSAGIYVGQDFDNLSDSRPNTVESGYLSPSAATQLIRVFVERTWNESARAALRQTLPLPVTVVGLTRELEGGG